MVLNIGTAMGFLGMCGMEFYNAMIQALPFLALALGVDDLFILLHSFRAQLTIQSIKEARNPKMYVRRDGKNEAFYPYGTLSERVQSCIGMTMAEAGTSVSLFECGTQWPLW